MGCDQMVMQHSTSRSKTQQKRHWCPKMQSKLDQ